MPLDPNFAEDSPRPFRTFWDHPAEVAHAPSADELDDMFRPADEAEVRADQERARYDRDFDSSAVADACYGGDDDE